MHSGYNVLFPCSLITPPQTYPSRAPRKVYERFLLAQAHSIKDEILRSESFLSHHCISELVLRATLTASTYLYVLLRPFPLHFTSPHPHSCYPPPLHYAPVMKEREEKEKSKLTIRLAEPVIYLKDVDFSGRRRTHNELSPPSIVRGILVLHLSKPTKICSIGIELTAKSSTRYPEGALPTRGRYRLVC